MGSHLFAAIIFFVCPTFLSSNTQLYSEKFYSTAKKNVSDFAIHRLSSDRVMISWHTDGESDEVRFEVMRKHGNGQPFVSLGFAEPKSKEGNSANYSFIDSNNFSDSSFYCLKKKNVDGVIFFSLARGVEGVGKDR